MKEPSQQPHPPNASPWGNVHLINIYLKYWSSENRTNPTDCYGHAKHCLEHILAFVYACTRLTLPYHNFQPALQYWSVHEVMIFPNYTSSVYQVLLSAPHREPGSFKRESKHKCGIVYLTTSNSYHYNTRASLLPLHMIY